MSKQSITIKHLTEAQYRELLIRLLDFSRDIGKKWSTEELELRCLNLGYLIEKIKEKRK